MKNKIAVFFFLLIGFSVSAQDVITLRNGSDIKAIVQEVGIETISYKRYDNQTGPIHIIRKSDVFMIQYANGSRVVFNEINVTADVQQLTHPVLSYRGGRVLKNNIERLSPSQVREVIAGNSLALNKYNNGRVAYILGQVILYPSVAVLGWGLGWTLAGGNANEALIWGGIGTVFGLITVLAGESGMRNAVRLYNANPGNTASLTIDFGATERGLGLSMRF